MASYNELNALIDAYINRNGVQAITGQILNGVLKAIVEQIGRGYAIMGVADLATNPGTPDAPESWFASAPGTYTNFGGLVVADAEFAIFSYTPQTETWEKTTLTEGIAQVDATIDGSVGTPAISVSYENGVLSFDFSNIKGATGPQGPIGPRGPRGNKGDKGDKGDTGATGPRGATGPQGNKGDKGDKGDTGAAAGFGTPVASVDANIGTPSVTISASGPNTAKVFTFSFHNLKGETGAQGEQGIQGPQGEKGDKGDKGDPGVDIYNGLDSDATDKALAAAQGNILSENQRRIIGGLDRLGDAQADTISSTDIPRVSNAPLVLFGYGAPSASVVPLNWDDKAGLWDGAPVFIGQMYVNLSANADVLYVAVGDTAVANWKTA